MKFNIPKIGGSFVLFLMGLVGPNTARSEESSRPFDMNASMRAAARGDLQRILSLRDAGADFTRLNSNGASVLYFAAQARSHAVEIFETVRQSVGEASFSELLNQSVSSNGHSVALEAVFNLNEPVVDYLLDLRAQGLKVDFESPTVFGWTPKTFANREKMKFADRLPEGRVRASDRIQWLSDEQEKWRAQLSGEKAQFHNKGLALIRAIENFDIEEIEDLIAEGVKINAHYGRLSATPLNSSVRPGMTSEELARALFVQARLFELGANPNFAEGGIMRVPSGFREAVFGYAELIDATIKRFDLGSPQRDFYLNYQGPLNGYTKLIDAAYRGHAEVIKILVEAGTNLSIKGHNGVRALDAARIYNSQSDSPLPQNIMKLLEAF